MAYILRVGAECGTQGRDRFVEAIAHAAADALIPTQQPILLEGQLKAMEYLKLNKRGLWEMLQLENLPEELVPCMHNDCCEKALGLYIAAKFGPGDYMRANLGRIPPQCKRA